MVAVSLYSAGITFLILKGVNRLTPIRVSYQDEAHGLDSSQHDESISAHVAMKYGREEARHIRDRQV